MIANEKHLLHGYELIITHNSIKSNKKWQKSAIFQGIFDAYVNKIWLRDG